MSLINKVGATVLILATASWGAFWWEGISNLDGTMTVSLVSDENVNSVQIGKINSNFPGFTITPLEDVSVWNSSFQVKQGFYNLVNYGPEGYGAASGSITSDNNWATGTLLSFTIPFDYGVLTISDLPEFGMNSYISTQSEGTQSFQSLGIDTFQILSSDEDSFVVTFDAGNGGSITSGDAVQTINYGESAIAPIITPYAGWLFTGWDADFSNITNDLTVTALYEVWVGDGTASNPYQISTSEHLEAVNNDLSAHYVLINDIDLGGIEYNKAVIARSTGTDLYYQGTPFAGSLDGNSFEIKNLTINGGENGYIGLFGQIGFDGVVKNLGIVDCDISGDYDVGGLCGQNFGNILSSYATGVVTCSSVFVGGLCGRNRGTINSSYAAGTVYGSVSYVGVSYVGGLCGFNYGTLTSSYATGEVSGSDYVGGLCGYNSGTITSSYATGAVSGNDGVGGFCGNNYQGKIIYCYSVGKVEGTSDIGGFVGRVYIGGSYEDTGNFWDMETLAVETSTMGSGKTTAQMKDMNTFLESSWDFVNETENGQMQIWYMLGEDYPKLYWQADAGDINYNGYVADNDLILMAWQWLSQKQESQRLQGDINEDGVVNLADFATFAYSWLSNP